MSTNLSSEKVLIFGNGQVGNLYSGFFKQKGIEAQIATADITKKEDTESAVNSFNPTVVINTAAKTNLEWCSQNKLEAYNVNVLGADNIARVCDEKGIFFIHFSSGCIFGSESEQDIKTEESKPNPGSYYAWTKVWSEELIKFEKSTEFKYLILRPRQPVSAQVNYKNMLVKMLTFTKFIDTPNTGTVLEDMLNWTLELIEKRYTGTLHIANEGWTTPYKIAHMLREHVLPELPIELITKAELDKIMPNKRVDTILDVSKLKSVVSQVGGYNERLKDVIKQLGENIRNADKHTLKIQLDKTITQSRQRTVVNEVWQNLL